MQIKFSASGNIVSVIVQQRIQGRLRQRVVGRVAGNTTTFVFFSGSQACPRRRAQGRRNNRPPEPSSFIGQSTEVGSAHGNVVGVAGNPVVAKLVRKKRRMLGGGAAACILSAANVSGNARKDERRPPERSAPPVAFKKCLLLWSLRFFPPLLVSHLPTTLNLRAPRPCILRCPGQRPRLAPSHTRKGTREFPFFKPYG